MATNRKKGTLTKVGTAVKKAARTVASKAEKYVVKPVGKALGMKNKKQTTKSATAKKTGTAKTAKRGSTKKTASGSTKKGTAKTAGRR